MEAKVQNALTAALRLLAAELESGSVAPNDGDIGDILTNGGADDYLDFEEIDKLCERINFGELVLVDAKS